MKLYGDCPTFVNSSVPSVIQKIIPISASGEGTGEVGVRGKTNRPWGLFPRAGPTPSRSPLFSSLELEVDAEGLGSQVIHVQDRGAADRDVAHLPRQVDDALPEVGEEVPQHQADVDGHIAHGPG
jgi:hypothetical protein